MCLKMETVGTPGVTPRLPVEITDSGVLDNTQSAVDAIIDENRQYKDVQLPAEPQPAAA